MLEGTEPVGLSLGASELDLLLWALGSKSIRIVSKP